MAMSSPPPYASVMLGNRLALSLAFLIFAGLAYATKWAIGDDKIADLVAVLLFLCLCALEQMGFLQIFRGFLRFALLIILPSAAFPLAFLGYLPFPQVTLWIAALVMIGALPVFWWQIAKRNRRDEQDIGR
jgi:hypothetical protein